jgi:DNA-directed RNA polymerase specialized sigma24 family protein
MLVHLRQAILGLPEQERLVVELFHLESLPVTRVIEMSGLPRSTVYTILIRAKSRLRCRLMNVGT